MHTPGNDKHVGAVPFAGSFGNGFAAAQLKPIWDHRVRCMKRREIHTTMRRVIITTTDIVVSHIGRENQFTQDDRLRRAIGDMTHIDSR